MLLTDATFISVNVAGAASVSRRTVTVELATDGAGVALRGPPTGVTDTSIIQVAQQTCQQQEMVKKALILKRFMKVMVTMPLNRVHLYDISTYSLFFEAYLFFRRDTDRQKTQHGRHTWSLDCMLLWHSHQCSPSSQAHSSH